MPLQIHSRSAPTLTAPHTIHKSFTRLGQDCLHLAGLSTAVGLTPIHNPRLAPGFLNLTSGGKTTFQDRLNPYLLDQNMRQPHHQHYWSEIHESLATQHIVLDSLASMVDLHIYLCVDAYHLTFVGQIFVQQVAR